MTIVRQATFKSTVSSTAIIVEHDEKTYSLSQAPWNQVTANTVQLAIRTATGRLDVWVHRNRDGSAAIAIGTEPSVWPEDDTEPR